MSSENQKTPLVVLVPLGTEVTAPVGAAPLGAEIFVAPIQAANRSPADLLLDEAVLSGAEVDAALGSEAIPISGTSTRSRTRRNTATRGRTSRTGSAASSAASAVRERSPIIQEIPISRRASEVREASASRPLSAASSVEPVSRPSSAASYRTDLSFHSPVVTEMTSDDETPVEPETIVIEIPAPSAKQAAITVLTPDQAAIKRADYKRPRPSSNKESAESASGSSEGPDKPKRKSREAKRGRERPPTHGEYIGQAQAKREASERRRAESRESRQAQALTIEKEMDEAERRDREAITKAGYGKGKKALLPDVTATPLAELQLMLNGCADEVVRLSRSCGHVKGSVQAGFNRQADLTRHLTGELIKRRSTDETERLQVTNTQLQAEIAALRQEVAELRAAIAASRSTAGHMEAELIPPTPIPDETTEEARFEARIRKVMHEERFFVRSLFEGIEDRLLPASDLRPPLAADRRKETVTPAPPPAASETFKVPEQPKPRRTTRRLRSSGAPSPVPTPAPAPTLAPTPGQSRDKTPAPRAAPNVFAVPPVEEESMLPSSTPANDGWRAVGRRKKGKKAPAPPNPAPAVAPVPLRVNRNMTEEPQSGRPANKKPAKKTRKPKLASPRCSAVVVSLTAEALEKGETYDKVLRRAREAMTPEDLEMASAPRARLTMTGARKFEFPGTQSSEIAEKFAQKLRETISDAATVTRPQKMITLAISDLDDSVSKDEVVMKLASNGGCPAADIKAGEIRTGRGGMGTIRVQCPVTAAKLILEPGRRLLIGFSAASVKAMEDRPLRCFRCLVLGHTSSLCPSQIQRDSLCRRCSKEGHKANTCTAKPHCAVCEAAKKPAGHVMGGRSCVPPPRKGKAKPASTGPPSSSQEMSQMDVETPK